jgi:putative toxin-antitoxin system antitoxin component (TIGR02293 family)
MAQKGQASIQKVRSGLPVRELTKLTSELAQPMDVWSKILGVSTRTMLRSRTSSKRLDANVSDRLERVKRIYALAQDVVGGPEKARLWLLRANRALQGEIPLELLDTDAGAQLVQEELYRIQYGTI